MNKKETKETYLPPLIKEIDLEYEEGVLVVSATLPEVEDGGDAFTFSPS